MVRFEENTGSEREPFSGTSLKRCFLIALGASAIQLLVIPFTPDGARSGLQRHRRAERVYREYAPALRLITGLFRVAYLRCKSVLGRPIESANVLAAVFSILAFLDSLVRICLGLVV